jgi:hypothetical protein
MARYSPEDKARQDIAIMDYHLAGKTTYDIASLTGLGHATVARRIKELVASFAPDVAEYRKSTILRLEKILKSLEPGMDGDAATRALTAGKILATIDSLRRLMGLDEPTRTSVETINLTPEDIELRGMVQEINSRAASTTDA